jgi:hypothetical protein
MDMMSRLTAERTGPPQGPGHYSEDGRGWFDDATRSWLPVGADHDTLQIELEDVNRAGWWVAVLATLASQSGNAYSRFVGRAQSTDPRWGTYEIRSATFPRVRGLPDSMTPQEAWAPGMDEALSELRTQLAAEGWQRSGHGEAPWAETYTRPRVLWPST